VDYLFASHHKGPRFKSPGGYLCETGILLLALSRYIPVIKNEKTSDRDPTDCETIFNTSQNYFKRLRGLIHDNKKYLDLSVRNKRVTVNLDFIDKFIQTL
jgi:hypothetical protein